MHSKRVMKKKDTNILKNTKPDTNIPLELKPLLTLKEASVYTRIGINKLRDMSNEKNCVLLVERECLSAKLCFDSWKNRIPYRLL